MLDVNTDVRAMLTDAVMSFIALRDIAMRPFSLQAYVTRRGIVNEPNAANRWSAVGEHVRLLY